MTLRVARASRNKLIGVLLAALFGSVAFVNLVGMMTSANVVLPVDRLSLPVGASNPSASLLASFVRIDAPDPPGSGQVRMVLSIDAGELTELFENYERGFKPETVVYPNDGGILMHNPGICRTTGGDRLRYVVFVHSAPENADRRQMLRETWANLGLFRNITFRVVFLVGLPPHEKQDAQAKIKDELQKYGDIVQGNFIDSYKNLTLKAVLGLRWLAEFCPGAPYALKADDDTFLNIFEMVPLMQANADKSHVIICPQWSENAMPILRNPKTCMKWCVKRSELRGRTHFPQYCAGIGYIVSQPLIPLLYNASQSTPFFWIDDVYVTGLLVKKLPVAISYVNTIDRFTAKQELAVQQYESHDTLTYLYVHAKDKDKFMSLWKALIKRLTDAQKNMVNADVLTKWSS